MKLTQKLKSLERNIVFMRWGASAEYGKINYVGSDFIEFNIIDHEDMEYIETVLINPSLVLEVVVQSPDINRVIAAVSINMPTANK